jgi:hypothetical protein
MLKKASKSREQMVSLLSHSVYSQLLPSGDADFLILSEKYKKMGTGYRYFRL